MLERILDKVCESITVESLEEQRPLLYEIVPNHFGSILSIVHPEPQFDEDGQGLLFSPAVPVTTKFARMNLPFMAFGVDGLRREGFQVKATQRCPLNGKVYLSKESLEPYLGQSEEDVYASLHALLELVVDESPPATGDPKDLETWNVVRVLQGKTPFK